MNETINLDQLRIATPCHARWEDMAGDDRARFCGQCQKNVFNLSAMTRGEVERLVREKEGNFCGRFYQRPDGRMLTADCPTEKLRRRHRLLRWGGSLVTAVVFFLGTRSLPALGKLKLKATNAPQQLPGRVVRLPVMGGMAAPTDMLLGKIAGPGLPPATNHGPVLMGEIAPPVRTNHITPTVLPKK